MSKLTDIVEQSKYGSRKNTRPTPRKGGKGTARKRRQKRQVRERLQQMQEFLFGESWWLYT